MLTHHPTGHSVIPMDLDENPIVAFWEVTRACALACIHCRAMAQPQRHPGELSTQEGFHLLDALTTFDHPPLVVLSGGDPLMRRDIFDLVDYGISKGLTVSISPTATKLTNDSRLQRLRDLGVNSVSISLDGATNETHDSFRGVAGSFRRTMDTIDKAVGAGLTVQVNTTITRTTVSELPAIAKLLGDMGITRWDVFFLVPTGRGFINAVMTPNQHEEVYNWLCYLSEWAPFAIKATLGQAYRRVQAQRKLKALGCDLNAPTTEELAQAWRGISSNDGKGILFVSHLGDVYPSGFLPLATGNVRRDSLVNLYHESPLFKQLRDPSNLKGKCGGCPFNTICGGCRARAYAFTGDPLEADPTCAFGGGFLANGAATVARTE